MTSSDRRIVAARKIEPAEEGSADGESEQSSARSTPKDTWPAPPPSEHDLGETGSRDTVPTPPPESGIAGVVVIPPLPDVDLEPHE